LPRISVNVSPLQFRRQNIVELVKQAVSEARLCTQALELEITESALMEDMDASIATLKQLQSLGIIISIDDFGTGYLSLSHLRSLPVDILKIDRSFIMNANIAKDDAQILAAIISMAHSLHLDLVAEGVECTEH
jgi:EAL domain-containing protein (putative c-di-GMP-specific phosphodiesterase class I)